MSLSSVNIEVILPELPPPLKHLSPYIQRAIELKKKDPIMCYWCLYFAAKQGVAAKGGKETRPFLFAVLELLEKTKAALIPHSDAVASDDAGSAYIENFALRVFTMADNEDRRGKASKSTAKKFLAAANFLELLSVFDVQDQTENEQKIRYSKWKAADIAKSIREGREPTPGPAGSAFADIMGPSGSTNPALAGTISPSTTIPQGESIFGSIPPSISASPLRNSTLLPPLPGTPPREEVIESDWEDVSPPRLSIEQELTPVSSPRLHGRTLSASSSKEPSPNRGSASATIPAAPHTPLKVGLSAPSGPGLKLGQSPGAWSTIATPGLDWATSPAISKNANGSASHPYVVEEGEDDDDAATDGGDAGSVLPPIRHSSIPDPKRQDSWSSTMATRGDTPGPSRSSSWAAPAFDASKIDEDDENMIDKKLSVIPETESNVPSSSISPAVEEEEDEATDKLTPLPPQASSITTSGGKKSVHFTPSVIGGLSSVASSSPPSSPGATSRYSQLAIGSEAGASEGGSSTATATVIPLPPSTDSEDNSGEEPTMTMRRRGPSDSNISFDEPPAESYIVPQLPSVPNGLNGAPRTSPPPGGGDVSSGNGTPPGSLSPRLRPSTVPPILSHNPHQHQFVLPSVPGDTSSNPRYPPTPYPRAEPRNLPPVSPRTSPAAPFSPESSPEPVQALPETLDAEETAAAKRATKFAMSALDYDDLDTARHELVKALAVLGVHVAI